MRHLTASIAILAALSFGGCSTVGALINGTAPTVADIQADAVSTCGFLPTAETVTGLITSANAAAAAGELIGSKIAALICGAVTKKSARLKSGLQLPVVNGVLIQGYFVK